MPPQVPTTTLSTLKSHQSAHPLSIFTLADPIISSVQQPPTTAAPLRISDASDDSNPTPLSLSSDLAHYESLFKKLRFSYLEQVTKEKFLRSIVGDPPVLISQGENATLEEELGRRKEELRGEKEQVRKLVEEMGEMARELAGRWDGVQMQVGRLEVLPGEVQAMEGRVRGMREELAGKVGDQPNVNPAPQMDLSLSATDALVLDTQARAREVEREIAALQRQLPGRIRECEVLEGELEGLERRRNEKTAVAREARRIKEEGGRDTVEEMGRWYRSKEVVLRRVLDVEVEG